MIPLSWLFSCTTELPDDTPYVDEPRVLAVEVEPAEVAAGGEVILRALYADRTGALLTAPIDWSFCVRTKPLAELGPVAASCLDPASADLVPIGSGLAVPATIPEDACSRFGPNPPPAEAGAESGRPSDPDGTGGYYQPALAFEDAQATLVPIRVRCGLANVDQDTFVAWNQAYHDNQHPEALALRIGAVTVPPAGEGTPPTVGAGDTVTLTVSWPDCAADETEGCAGAETYVLYDAGALVERREAISVTWFATAGTFEVARDGRDGDDPSTSVDDRWTAPDAPGDVWIAVVLRDERGGVGFSGYRLAVGQ